MNWSQGLVCVSMLKLQPSCWRWVAVLAHPCGWCHPDFCSYLLFSDHSGAKGAPANSPVRSIQSEEWVRLRLFQATLWKVLKELKPTLWNPWWILVGDKNLQVQLANMVLHIVSQNIAYKPEGRARMSAWQINISEVGQGLSGSIEELMSGMRWKLEAHALF